MEAFGNILINHSIFICVLSVIRDVIRAVGTIDILIARGRGQPTFKQNLLSSITLLEESATFLSRTFGIE